MKLRCLLLSLVLVLGGCGRSDKRTIAVIPKATAHLFWVSIQAGAMAAGEDLGVNIEWNGPASETDFSRQIQIVDSMVARRVDGIALAAAERKALVASVERAVANGIPVVVFDSGLDSDQYMTFIATNNHKAGQLAARTLAALIGAKGAIAVLAHTPGSKSTMDREDGFYEAMAKEFPNIKIVARQFGMSDRAKAMANAENMLAAHPELDGFFASAEPSAVGASLALKSRGMAGKLKYVAFDSSDALVDDLRAGVIDALVVQDPFKMGYDSVKAIVDKLNGKTPPKRVDLDTTVVRRADLERPEIQQLIKPSLSKHAK